MLHQRITGCVVTVLVSSAIAIVDLARAGDVVGLVRDRVTSDGIPAANVALVPQLGGSLDIGPTDGAGQYDKANVTNGTYQLEVDAKGFARIGPPISVTVKTGSNQLDVIYLVATARKPDYYIAAGAACAKDMKLRHAGPADKRAAYKFLWDSLTQRNLPPVSKFYLAQGIGQTDDEAKSVSEAVRSYLDVPPDNLARAETALTKLFDPDFVVPSKSYLTSDLRVSDPVLSDVLLYTFRTKGSKAQNKQVFDRLKVDEAWAPMTKAVEGRYELMVKKSSDMSSNPP